MSRCPRCKTSLPARETAPPSRSSDGGRLPKSDRRPTAEVPPLVPPQPSEQPLPANTQPTTILSSKHSAILPELDRQTGGNQQYSSTLSWPPSGQILAPLPPQQLPLPLPPLPKALSLLGWPQAKANASTPTEMGSLRQSKAQSQYQAPFPPSDDLRFASSRRKHSGERINLDLRWSPKPDRHRRPRHADWVRSGELMIDEVPLGRKWQEALAKKDSSLLAAVVMDGALVAEGDVSSQDEDAKPDQLVRLVRGFARRHSEGRIIFERFILVCLCNVLSDRGVPQDQIVQTLQICITDTSKANVMKYLRGSIWLNELMSDLFFTEWGYRSIDLIVICRSP